MQWSVTSGTAGLWWWRARRFARSIASTLCSPSSWRTPSSRGHRVCYFGAGERLELSLAGNPSWSRVLLGAQPSWDPRQWSEAVAKRPSLRAQFNRARNKNIVVSEWPAKEAENHPALRRCLEEWLNTRNLPPLHFLVEPETLRQLEDRRVFVATRGGRAVVAFTVLSPVSARNGWLVEQIVRGRAAPNGTAELLIDSAMRAVGDAGFSYATLGLSPLSQRGGFPPPRLPMWLRLVLRVGATSWCALLQFRRTGDLQGEVQSADMGAHLRARRQPAILAARSLRDRWRVQRRRAHPTGAGRVAAGGAQRGRLSGREGHPASGPEERKRVERRA